jgi:hypothetical protein
MAVSLGFGVLFATGITLLLVPCGYVILDDIQRIFTGRKLKPPVRECGISYEPSDIEASL